MEGLVFKIGEYMVEPILNLFRPIFCFQTIIKEFGDQKNNLSLRQDRVKNDVKAAKNNSQAIEKDVQQWLAKVDTIMEVAQRLESQLHESQSFFEHWCPKLTCRYRLSKQLHEKAIAMKALWEFGKFDRVMHSADVRQYIGPPGILHSLSKPSATRRVLEALRSDDISIIGIYGMGGIGKTTLAKYAAKEAEGLEVFDRFVMVTVSQNPQIRSIQGTISDFLGLKFEQDSEQGRAANLNWRLENEKTLIILDDVWKKFDLAAIGIYGDASKSCKIILTTRRKQVCDSMNSQETIEMQLMSEDEAWDLFKETSGLSDDSKLNGLAKQIVRECKCLPIAITTVGSALRNKRAEQWKEALKQLEDGRLVEIIGIDDADEKNAYKCLRLSYDYLKHQPKAEAQFLFLLCSLFPEDHEIDLEDLARHAFGLDLFERVRSFEDVRRKVRVTVDFLKDSCLLLGTDKEECVKMHDVVRDVALWIGGTKSEEERNVIAVKDCTDLKDQMKKTRFRNCKAISFMPESIDSLSSIDELDCPNLEMITFFGECDINLPDGFFKHMEALKVLDVTSVVRWRKYNFSMPQSLSKLRNLKTLYFRFYQCLNSSVLGELRKLEILSLDWSSIDVGVGAMLELKKLLVRDCVDMKTIFNISTTPSHLFKLQELCLWGNGELEHVFGYQNEAKQLLLNWSSLEKLEVWGCPKVSIDFIKKILQAQAKQLRIISLGHIGTVKAIMHWEAHREDDELGDELVTFPLEKLNLWKLSDLEHIIWSPNLQNISFSNLTEIKVSDCNKLKNLFATEIARHLEQLQVLHIERCNRLEMVVAETNIRSDQLHEQCGNIMMFPKLDLLTLIDLPELTRICPAIRDLALPSLVRRYLKVERCPKMMAGNIFSSQGRHLETEEIDIYRETISEDDDGSEAD